VAAIPFALLQAMHRERFTAAAISRTSSVCVLIW
jgi:hypothetical protein